MDEVEELDAEIHRLRGQKQTPEAKINEFQSVIGFNEELLDDAASSAFDSPSRDGDGDVTDTLIDDTVTCWTCGSDVDEEQIRMTVDYLRD